eukprot:1234053-Amphidinium_carterae.1
MGQCNTVACNCRNHTSCLPSTNCTSPYFCNACCTMRSYIKTMASTTTPTQKLRVVVSDLPFVVYDLPWVGGE